MTASPLHRLTSTVILLAGLLLLAAAPVARAAGLQVEGRRLSVGAADMQSFIETRFPLRYAPLGPLLALDVSRPRLSLPPGPRLRLLLDLAVATGGAPVPLGTAELSSALRYDPAGQAFHLDQPRIERFLPASGQGRLDESGRGLLNAWLADYARTEPVYRIDPALAAMLGGLQVQDVAIADGRLAVTFDRDLGAIAPAVTGE